MPTPPKNPNEAFEAYDRIRRQRSLTVDSATEVAQRFGFHKATIEGPEVTQPKHVLLRRAFMLFAQDLYALLPEGHYRGLAVDDLERASMWAHKAIASRAPLETDPPEEGHTEETSHKVYKALLECGMNGDEATEAMHQILNQGILFREIINKEN